MFNPATLSPAEKKAIIESLKQTRNNPIAMLKLKVLGNALNIKRYIEANAPQMKKDFTVIYQGFENQTAKLFDNFEQELLQKLGSDQ